MARSSKVHYIQSSSVAIIPNANGSADDLAVTIARDAKIQVYSHAIAALAPDGDGRYQEWTLKGRNRRLADSAAPYTIFARLPKSGERDGYLVFAPKWQPENSDEWLDKYRYVTPDGLADIPGEFIEDGNWYIRLGDVTLPDENGKRAVTFDAGLLGTPQYNEEWELNPDQLPLRVELGCTVSDEDAGPTPYVYWGQSLVLTATLMEGWAAGAVDRFDHWEITRSSGDAAADELWNHPNGAGSYRTLDSNGSIVLSHARGAGDVFNGAVAATFTVTAMGTEGGAPVPLASAGITILAETVEKYELALSAAIVSFNPQATQGNAYSPQGGVDVRVRATDQRGNAFNVTFGQMASAGLAVEYAPVGSDTWTPLAFSGAQGALAVATIGTAAFSSQQSLNVRLMSGSGQDRTELVRTTIAFVRDGEDSREREWIYTRRTAATTFSGSTGADALPSLITLGEVSPDGVADGNVAYNNTTDEWVPNGWTDNPQGVDETHPYEYGAYRDFNHNGSGSGSWGSFSEPRIYNHYGKDGEDAYTVSANPPAVSFQCDPDGKSTDSGVRNVTLSMFKGASPVAFTATVGTQTNCSARIQGSVLTISTYNNNTYADLAQGGSVTVRLTDADGVYRDLVIPVIGNRKGGEGQPGSAGPMLYPAGQWEAKTYTASGNSRPYVLYTYTDAGGNIISNYYYLSADSAAANEPPVDASGNPSDKWTLMTQADVVFAKFAIMDYGELASAVFCGDWMYSQYGTMYANGSSFAVDDTNSEQPVTVGGRTAEPFAWFNPDYPQGDPEFGVNGTFAPNWAVNLKTGEQYSSGGKVYFNSDGSGYLAGGNISWNENGYITIKSINTGDKGNVLNGLITFEDMFHSTSWASGGATVLGIQPQRHFDHLDITRNSQQVTDSSVLNLGEMNARFPAISRVTALEAYFTGGVAKSAFRLSGNGVCTAWGRTYWENGVPKQTVEGTLDNVADINMTGKITIGSGSNRFVIELTSDGLKFGGNIYATGSVAAYGASGSGSGGGDAPVISTQYLDDLLDVDLPSQLSDGKVLTYRNGYWTAEAAQVQDLTNYATKTFVQQNYVAKESGKGLSSNDFTDALLARLNGIEEGANKYIHPSYSAAEITASAGKVLSAITVNGLGHVTNVASKTLAAADIPALAASKITSGAFDAARIPSLDASKITSGSFDVARIPSLTKSKISDFPTTWAWSAITGKPTTLEDYGITDAATAAQMTAATGRISALEGYFDGGVANSAKRLSGNATYTAWGQIYWQNGAPKGNVNGDIDVNGHSRIIFWQDSYIHYIHADNNDWLHLHGNNGILLDGLTSIDGFVIQNDNSRLKLNGSVYATGAVSCLGTSASGSEVTGAVYLRDLQDVLITGTPQTNYVLTFNGSNWVPQASQGGDMSQYATKTWVEQNWVIKNMIESTPTPIPADGRTYINACDLSLSGGTLICTHIRVKDTFLKADITDFEHRHYTSDINGISNYALLSDVSQLRSDVGSVVTGIGVDGDTIYCIYRNVDPYHAVAQMPVTVPFATRTMGFKRLNKEAAGTWDANTMTVGGVQYALLTNYRSTSEWANMPSGMSWGGVLQITAGYAGVLSGQLAWDSNHGVTTGVTRKLYWRSRNSSGWGTNDWHTIAFEDWVTNGFLPLTGGTLKGDLVLGNQNNTTNDDSAKIAFRTNDNYPNISPYIQAINEANYGRKRLSVFQKNAEDWNTPQVEVLSVMPDGKLRLTQAISYKGTVATYDMISFIDNKSNQWGNGIAIGGGGATIIGGGESAATMIGQLPKVTVDGVEYIDGGSELMYIGNDTSVSIFTNLGTASGWANRKEFFFGADGRFWLPQGGSSRQVILHPDGQVQFRAATGGWAFSLGTFNNAGSASLGQFGSYGEGDSLNYMYIGQSYNNTWMVVKPSGNVGIGTTSPSKKLHVNGDALFEKWVTIKGNNGVVGLEISDTNGTHDFTAFWNTQTINNVSREIFTMYSYETKYWDMCIGTHPNAVGYGGLYMYNSGNNVLRWGIGTTTPDSKLHVVNECHFAGGAKFNNICIEVNNSIAASGRGSEINNYNGQLLLQYNTSTHCSICYGGGNVGIGKHTPSYKLDVDGSGCFSGDGSGYGLILANDKAVSLKDSGGTIRRALFLNTNNQLAIGYGTTRGGASANQYDTAIFGRFISFGTGGGSDTDPAIRMTIDKDGKVGIGTTTPTDALLHVAGKLRIGNGFIEWDAVNQMLKFSGGKGIYAMGAVSALGIAGDLNGQVTRPMTFTQPVTISSTLSLTGTINANATIGQYTQNNKTQSYKLCFGDVSHYIQKDANNDLFVGVSGVGVKANSGGVTIVGETVVDGYLDVGNNHVRAKKYYLDDTRYLYVNGSSLMYYNGTTTKTVQLA